MMANSNIRIGSRSIERLAPDVDPVRLRAVVAIAVISAWSTECRKYNED